ncbi:MAG: hypothetical protein AAGA16_21705 [Cyanobacteria bacterium P01_E01_bin.35]
MADSKDNPKKPRAASNSDSEAKEEKPQQPTAKRKRLKFKEEDMIKIKYNF